MFEKSVSERIRIDRNLCLDYMESAPWGITYLEIMDVVQAYNWPTVRITAISSASSAGSDVASDILPELDELTDWLADWPIV